MPAASCFPPGYQNDVEHLGKESALNLLLVCSIPRGAQGQVGWTFSGFFFALESLFTESFIPLVVAEKGGDQGKASIWLTSSVLCI